MPRITYSDDFKREAVRLVTDEGHSRKAGRPRPRRLRRLAPRLDPPLAPDEAVVSDKLPEAEQIRQLKRELDRLQQERDILKKAVGIFSQMPPRT